MKKEHPILFSTPMVKAILENRKTQTRRIIKPQSRKAASFKIAVMHDGTKLPFDIDEDEWMMDYIKCPYGQPGDILWVRETWNTLTAYDEKPDYSVMSIRDFVYKVDDDRIDKWKPSIFMPKEACRIRLEITDIRVERLNDISEDDALSEGVFPVDMTAEACYSFLWDSINGKGSWEKNPWVWVISFKRIDNKIRINERTI